MFWRSCFERDFYLNCAELTAWWWVKICPPNRTMCWMLDLKVPGPFWKLIMSFFFEIFVLDKKSACFALGGALKAREFWTLVKCEIECCTGDNCNTQAPTVSQSAITVFTPDGNTKHLGRLLIKKIVNRWVLELKLLLFFCIRRLFSVNGKCCKKCCLEVEELLSEL